MSCRVASPAEVKVSVNAFEVPGPTPVALAETSTRIIDVSPVIAPGAIVEVENVPFTTAVVTSTLSAGLAPKK